MSVVYPAPTILAGAPPVTLACTPPSVSSSAIGSTAVRCTATDARLRADSCAFTVTVVAAPRIAATNFVCFGDSMTLAGLDALILPSFIPNPPGSYPADLQTLLAGRYSAQSVSVLDEGIGGKRVDVALKRLPSVLSSDRPEALLLLEGVNDLNAFGAVAIPAVVSGLQAMVRDGRARGVPVFLGTLLPQRPRGSRAFAPTLIEPANQQIRAMASAEGAVLVDLYRDFGGEAGRLIGDDGLHPNAEGYQRMAESFFAAIRARFEVTQVR